MTRVFVGISLATIALVMTSLDAAAQSIVCEAIQPGDTASAIARRVTGRAGNRHQPWFRIVNRAKSNVIPKAAYNRILTGWQVCIPATRLTPQLSASPPTDTVREPQTTVPAGGAESFVAQPPMAAATPSRDSALELAAFVLLAPAVFGAAIGFGWQGVERFLTKRRSLKRKVQEFGDLFVRDFERPLVVDGVASRPIRARLRWVSHDRRLDILLAPAAGRRYPNLADHRRNVEYDVDRIAHRLRHHPFVRTPLRTEGEWVVVPFKLTPGPHTGAWI